MSSNSKNTVCVSGIPKDMEERRLYDHFTNSQASGGGELDLTGTVWGSLQADDHRSATLVFQDHADADRVVAQTVHYVPLRSANDPRVVEVMVSWHGNTNQQEERKSQVDNADGFRQETGSGCTDVATSVMSLFNQIMSMPHLDPPVATGGQTAASDTQEKSLMAPPVPMGPWLYANASKQKALGGDRPDFTSTWPTAYEGMATAHHPPGAIGQLSAGHHAPGVIGQPSVGHHMPGVIGPPPGFRNIFPNNKSVAVPEVKEEKIGQLMSTANKRKPPVGNSGNIVIQVTNIDPELTEERILFYFSQQSQGCLVEESCSFDKSKRCGTITINSVSVAKGLLENKQHNIKGYTFNVCKSRPEAPKVVDSRRLLLKAEVDLTVVPSETLLSYIKNRAGMKKNDQVAPTYEYLWNKKAVLVTFERHFQELDVEEVIQQISKRSMVRGIPLTAEKVYHTNWALVENLAIQTDEEDLRYHFEELEDINESDILEIQTDHEVGRANVQFFSHQVLEIVLLQSHELHGQTLTMKPYYPAFKLALCDDSIGTIDMGPFRFEVEPHLLEYVYNQKPVKHEIEIEMKKCSAYIIWPRDFQAGHVTIQSTLREAAPVAVKKHWAHLAKLALRKKLSGFKTIAEEVSPELSMHLTDILRQVEQDEGVAIRPCRLARTIHVTGRQQAVLGAWDKIKVSLESKEQELKAMKVPKEVTIPLQERWKAEVLEASNVLNDLSVYYPITFQHHEQSLRVKGEKQAVDIAIHKLNSLWQSARQIQITKPQAWQEFVQSKRVKEYIGEKLRKQNIIACFVCHSNGIMVCGKTKEEAETAAKVLEENIFFKVITMSTAVDEARVKDEIENLRDKYKERVTINTAKVSASGSCVITLVALTAIGPVVQKELQTILEGCICTKTEIQTPSGQIRFVFSFCNDKLNTIESDYGVVIRQGNGVIKLQGASCAVTVAAKVLQTAIMEQIQQGELQLRKVGIGQYYDSQEGISKLKAIEDRLQCVIDFKMSETSRQKEFLSHMECQLNNGRQILVCKGNMTHQRVDIIVNAANETLSHTGGLAKAILDAGGPVIQQESQNIIDTKLELAAGSIAVTSAGNLPCKKVIHAVGPRWKRGHHHKRKLLMSCITKSLQEADNQGVQSIAFPAISGGIFCYPISLCTEIIVTTIYKHLNGNVGSLKEVRLVDTNENALTAFKDAVYKVAKEDQPRVPSPTGQRDDLALNATKGTGTFLQMKLRGTLYLEVIQGDITAETTDCIVSSTNESLSLSRTVAKTISMKAGPVVQQELQRYERIPQGGILVTSAGNLPSKKILHVVLPQGDPTKEAIRLCMHTAEQYQMRSIAFPLLGTALHPGRVQSMQQKLLDGIEEFTNQYSPKYLRTVRVTIFQQHMFADFCALVRQRTPRLGPVLPQVQASQYVLPKGSRANAMSPPVDSVLKKLKGPQLKPGRNVVLGTGDNREDAQFTVYASSRDIIEKAKTEITNDVEAVCGRGSIQNLVIKNLNEIEKDEILSVSGQRAVEVKIGAEGLDCITITGPRQERQEATKLVNSVLRRATERIHEEEKEELIAAKYAWYYIQEDKELIELPQQVVIHIHKLANKRKGTLQFQEKVWQVHINANGDTGWMISGNEHKQIVRRDRSDDVPVHWENRESDSVNVVQLGQNTAEYRRIETLFTSSVGSACFKVRSINRIENTPLYRQYCARKEGLAKKLRIQVERQLFHGTCGSLCNKINQHGFNRSFNSKSNFGAGVYFACDAQYSASNSYSKPDVTGMKHMYVSRVLVGEYTVGTHGMREPPTKVGTELYDSVVDSIHNPRIFVVFHDASAYPEYLIKFST